MRVLRIDRPDGRRVLKFDGPSGRGLRWRLRRKFIKKGRGWRRGLCRRVASLRSGGDSACGAEGGGLPLCGNAYKISVTELAFYVIWHDRHSADWLAALASPYPASPDCPRLRGWQKNWIHRGAPRPANPVTCFPPGKVVAPATKGGMHFLARRAVVKVFAAKGGIYTGAPKGAVPRQRSGAS